MAAYAIGMARSVSDPEGFTEYQRLAGPTVEQYGGKFVAGGDKIEVGDGDWSPVGIVVIEFESMERLKRWYNSPEYSAAKPRRLQTADTGLIFVDGG
jgi:uncharacterized protein (DUF1330 family)